MSSDRTLKVGISGSYGGFNLGDEAILHVILSQLRRSLTTEITVFSRDAEDTRRRHRVEHVFQPRELSRRESQDKPRHDFRYIYGEVTRSDLMRAACQCSCRGHDFKEQQLPSGRRQRVGSTWGTWAMQYQGRLGCHGNEGALWRGKTRGVKYAVAERGDFPVLPCVVTVILC
jgi:hypothetical protein